MFFWYNDFGLVCDYGSLELWFGDSKRCRDLCTLEFQPEKTCLPNPKRTLKDWIHQIYHEKSFEDHFKVIKDHGTVSTVLFTYSSSCNWLHRNFAHFTHCNPPNADLMISSEIAAFRCHGMSDKFLWSWQPDKAQGPGFATFFFPYVCIYVFLHVTC